MATVVHNLSGTIRAPVFNGTLAPGGFSGDGSQITSLTRANVAAGTADHVVINGGAGLLSSEAKLLPVRSGLGSTSLALTPPYTHWNDFLGSVRPTDAAAVDAVMPAIISGTAAGIFNPITAATAAIANTLVLRDGSGNISGGGTTISQTISSATTVTVLGPSTNYIVSSYVRTTPGATNTLLTIAPDAGFSGTYTIEALTTVVKLLDQTVHGSFRTLARVRYNNGVANPNTWTTPAALMEDSKSLEAGISTAAVTLLTTGANLILQVTGVAGAGNTLDWSGQVRIAYQRMLAV